MNSLGTVVRLRLKMTEFFDTEIESWVINRINEIYKLNQFKLHLWYENDEISPAQIKKFINIISHGLLIILSKEFEFVM